MAIHPSSHAVSIATNMDNKLLHISKLEQGIFAPINFGYIITFLWQASSTSSLNPSQIYPDYLDQET